MFLLFTICTYFHKDTSIRRKLRPGLTEEKTASRKRRLEQAFLEEDTDGGDKFPWNSKNLCKFMSY